MVKEIITRAGSAPAALLMVFAGGVLYAVGEELGRSIAKDGLRRLGIPTDDDKNEEDEPCAY